MRNREWITTTMEGKFKKNAEKGRPIYPFMKQIIKDIDELSTRN